VRGTGGPAQQLETVAYRMGVVLLLEPLTHRSHGDLRRLGQREAVDSRRDAGQALHAHHVGVHRASERGRDARPRHPHSPACECCAAEPC
jgi:hypothetical protein